MTLMICADVLLRNVRVVPAMRGLGWANEISEAMLYLITHAHRAVAAAARAAHPRRHRAARRAAARGLGIASGSVDVLGLACCALIAWYGARAALASFKAGSLSIKTLVTPEWWLLSAAAGRLRAARRSRCCSACAASRSPSARRATTRSRRARACHGDAAAWLMLGGSTVLLFLGLPVAFSFLVINLLGALLFLGGEPGLVQLARNSVSSVASFSLTPIPLFILMGEVLFHTGLAVKVIDGVERLIRQVPGRLAVVAVVAGTVFSAISGSTIATTAMLGSLMLPVMLSRGYHPTMATGPLMAIGAVDMLIPPSALTVLLGSLSGISISKLLIGGVVPGLILSVAFVVYIVARVKLNPALAPAAALHRVPRLGDAACRSCST